MESKPKGDHHHPRAGEKTKNDSSCQHDAVPVAGSTHRGRAEPESNPCGPEAGLGDVGGCRKNPNHVGFIPVKEFDIHHLPEEYREEGVVEKIKAYIPLVVHLGVRHVSVYRPDVYPDSNDPYPYSDFRGRSKYRTGSGFVTRVTKCGEGGKEKVDQTCDCKECIESGNPMKSWWEFEIQTAAHVTFDQSEVESTEVRFFYDERHSERHVCRGYQWKDTLIDGERCHFTVAVHCMNLGGRIKKAWDHLRYLPLKLESGWIRASSNIIVVVISHPHGCSKFITVGTLVGQEFFKVDRQFGFLTYSAATCPGSSGGLVVISFGADIVLFGAETCPHSEALADGNGRSGAGDMLFWRV